MEKWQCQVKMWTEKEIHRKAKGFNIITEELKQHISAKTSELKWYKSRVKQYQQNRTFKNNRKALYEELDWKIKQEQVMSYAEESIKFCSELWDNPVDYDKNAEWIMTVENG